MSAAAYLDDEGRTWLPIPEDDSVRWSQEDDALIVGGDPVMSTSTHYLVADEPEATRTDA